MAITMMGIVWYLESSALLHMTGNKKKFSDLAEKDLRVHTNMGYHGNYNATKIGIVMFQREFGSPLNLKDVMFFLGLKKNIVFIEVLEDSGYNVIFNKGK